MFATPHVEALEDRTLLDAAIGGAPVSSPEGTAIPLQGLVSGLTGPLTFTWRAAKGVSRNALQFDGVNDIVQINRMVQDDFTIEAWIKTTTSRSGTQFFEGLGLIYADVPGPANDFGVSILNNKLAFGIGKPDTTITSTSTVTSGEWVHVAATRVRSGTVSTFKVFINGVLEATGTTTNVSALNASPVITIGGNVTDRRYFNGTIDEVRLWNVARSAADIQADMDRMLNGNEAGLVNYYRFDDGSGTTAHDQTGSGNEGNLGNNVAANRPAWVTAVAPVQGRSTQTGAAQDFVFTPNDNYPAFVTFKATTSTGTTSSATVTIAITNANPTATLNGDSVLEGQIATVTFSEADDPSADDRQAGFTYSFDFDNDGVFEVIGSASPSAALPAALTADGPASITVRGRITDKDGGFTEYTTTVEVANVPPTAAITGQPGTSDAGTRISLAALVSDPGDDTFRYAWTVTRDGQPFATGDAADFSFTPTVAGTYVVSLTVTDDDGDSGHDQASITVVAINNPPTVGITAPLGGVRGQVRVFTLRAYDDSAADREAGFCYRINWGDGSPVQVVNGPGSGVRVAHVFAAAGTWTVTVVAVDQHHAVSAPARATITIRAIELQPDPLYPGRKVLAVGGTPATDVVFLTLGPRHGVTVRFGGRSLGTFSGAQRLLVFGQAGNDRLTVSEGLRLPAWLYGDDGHDQLWGGGGDDVLLGGRGRDVLHGRLGRDLLIGGLDADVLRGGPDGDLLIGDTTSHEGDEAALAAIMSEWTARPSFATRRANLGGTGKGPSFTQRRNGDVFLTVSGVAASVREDGAADVLDGGPGEDWLVVIAADRSSDPSGRGRPR